MLAQNKAADGGRAGAHQAKVERKLIDDLAAGGAVGGRVPADTAAGDVRTRIVGVGRFDGDGDSVARARITVCLTYRAGCVTLVLGEERTREATWVDEAN